MAEILVKNQVCKECGSDVRAESLFCYHCGGALETEIQDENNAEEPSDVWFRSEIAPVTEDKKKKVVEETFSNQEPELVEKKNIENKVESEKETVETKSELEEEKKVNFVKPKPFKEKPKKKSSRGRYSRRKSKKLDNSKLKSAAAIRKREKPSRLKKVEIVWEERENSPNIWFIVFALFLSLIVAGLVVIAFYLK